MLYYPPSPTPTPTPQPASQTADYSFSASAIDPPPPNNCSLYGISVPGVTDDIVDGTLSWLADTLEYCTSISRCWVEYGERETHLLLCAQSSLQNAVRHMCSKFLQLCFCETITDIEQLDPGWWRGVRQLDGSYGLFPANYVELI